MAGPVRTCIGCRGRGDKSELIRLVTRAAEVTVDARQVAPGRGAYLHRSSACLDLAVRRRAVGRALKSTSVDGQQLAQVMQPHLGLDGGIA